jgi:hypothetical protein
MNSGETESEGDELITKNDFIVNEPDGFNIKSTASKKASLF